MFSSGEIALDKWRLGVSSSSIAPAGTATRAQVATILMRFCSKQDKYIRFKEKDVDDFADCEVINLDDSDETNFAVLADEPVITETISSENRIIEIDEENGTYKFANINNDISSLKVGDILYHTYGDGDDDYLLLKVGAIDISGTTAIITEGQAELEDFFQYVDIDMDIDVSGSDYAAAGVDFVTNNSTRKFDDVMAYTEKPPAENEVSAKLQFGYAGNHLSLTAETSVTFNVKISIDKVIKVNEIKFSVKTSTELTASLKQDLLNYGDGEPLYEKPTNPVKIEIFPGMLAVEFSAYLKFDIKASVKGEIKATYESESGTIYRNGKSEQIKEADVDMNCSLLGEVGGSFCVGVNASLVGFEVLKIGFDGEAGSEIKASLDSKVSEAGGPELHLCDVCITGSEERYMKITMEAGIGFSKKHSFKLFEWEIAKISLGKKDFYISSRKENGVSKIECKYGKCPHKAYRITVNVKDKSGKALDEIPIEIINKATGTTDQAGKTNQNGQFQAYCTPGEYKVNVIVPDGYAETSLSDEVTLSDESAVVTLVLTPAAPPSNIVASGNCGAQGDNVKWTLDTDGLLTISGKGDMGNFEYPNYAPWSAYNESILEVSIQNGITSIGGYAFYSCTSLSSIMAIPHKKGSKITRSVI